MRIAYLGVGILLASGGLLLSFAEFAAPCVNPLDPAVRELPTCDETRTLTLVGFVMVIFGIVLFLSGRSRRIEEAPYLNPARPAVPFPEPVAPPSQDVPATAPAQKVCPACGVRYAVSMTFCPMDGTALRDLL